MEIDKIRKVLIDQKEEIDSLGKRMQFIERDCFAKYKKYIDSKQIKVITGIRRCGKSTLAYQLIRDRKFAYVNFDDELLATIKTEELNNILEILYQIYGNFDCIFFDEIQNINRWELFVNRLHRQGFNLIITGSNAKLLSKELSTHLTGRHIALELFPFSFREYLKYIKAETKSKNLTTKETAEIKRNLETYISSGGFPDVIKEPDNQRIHLQSIYSNILDKDVILRHKLKFNQTLKEISNALMSDPASQVSFNKIKNTFNLKSIHTAMNYLSFIEETYLFFLLPRFSYKSKERSIANRKLYSIDTGMLSTLGFNASRNKGKIYENTVFLELIRNKSENFIEIYYWQDKYHGEVDFVIKQDAKIKELIQVCTDLSDPETKKREIKSILQSGEVLKCKNLTIITEDTEKNEIIEKSEIKYIPLWKWLIENE